MSAAQGTGFCRSRLCGEQKRLSASPLPIVRPIRRSDKDRLLLGMGMKLGPENNQRQIAVDFSDYLDGLYSYAVVLSRNRTEAEDLVQETCLRALRAMERLRPDSNVKSWLFTILRNIWLNQLRQSPTVSEAFDDDAGEEQPSRPADTAKDPYASCGEWKDSSACCGHAARRRQVKSSSVFCLKCPTLQMASRSETT